jgi:hypothetical protein
VSTRTVRRRLSSVSGLFAFLHARGDVAANPVPWGLPTRRERQRPRQGVPLVRTPRGSAYCPGTPREGWDDSTGYLRRILVDIWGADLTVVEREFTWSASTRPSTQFTDLAAAMKATAHDAAAAADKALAAR